MVTLDYDSELIDKLENNEKIQLLEKRVADLEKEVGYIKEDIYEFFILALLVIQFFIYVRKILQLHYLVLCKNLVILQLNWVC